MAGTLSSPVAPARPDRRDAGRLTRRRAQRSALLTTVAATAATALALLPALDALPASAALAAHKATTTTTTTTKQLSRADSWLAQAIKAEIAVGSVHIDGTIKQGKQTITLHLVVNGDGNGGGHFVQHGSTLNMLRVGPLLYFKAPFAFWSKTATPAQAQTYGGRWIELSALDVRFQSFDQFLDAADLVSAAFQGHPKPLTVSKPTTYAGHKVVIVKDVVHGNGKTSKGFMYIGASGKAYVYRLVNDTPGELANLVFSHYGKQIPITIPPNAINLT